MQTDGDNRLVADRYRLAGKLGAGGMGVVWQAYDERLHRQVAVKQLLLPAGLSSDEATQAKRKITREGRIAARLQHPHAIMVYDVTEDRDQPYLIMEYLPSRSLADTLAGQGTLPPQEVARIGADVAAALATAHAAGVVHRDIKPGNILLGDDGVVKITDFGISRAVEDVAGTLTSAIIGTPAYLSPEVARGVGASFASDVYSLGATLYAAVEGAPPYGFDDNAIALLYRVSSGQFAPPANAGPLTGMLLALLRTEPDQRPTMAQASEALAALAGTADAAGTAIWTDVADWTNVAGIDAAVPSATKTKHLPPTTGLTALFPAAPPSSEPHPSEPHPSEAPSPEPPPSGLPSPEQHPSEAPTPEPSAAPDLQRPIKTDGARTGGWQSDRRKRLAVLVAAVITLLVLGAAVLVLVNQGQPDEGTSASQQPPPPSPTATGEPTASQAPQQPPPSARDSAGATPPSTTSAAEPPSQPPPANPQPPADPQSPQAALIDYYALMPRNLQEGWTRLTPRFQTSPAGGFAGYQRFWGQVSSVQASEVTPGPGGRVEVTIVYHFNDGRVVRERHRYFLVFEQDRWLIDTSTVLSSVTL